VRRMQRRGWRGGGRRQRQEAASGGGGADSACRAGGGGQGAAWRGWCCTLPAAGMQAARAAHAQRCACCTAGTAGRQQYGRCAAVTSSWRRQPTRALAGRQRATTHDPRCWRHHAALPRPAAPAEGCAAPLLFFFRRARRPAALQPAINTRPLASPASRSTASTAKAAVLRRMLPSVVCSGVWSENAVIVRRQWAL
jgi:hypothetical protein